MPLFRSVSAGCFANGTVTGSDHAGDCAVLVALYKLWGNQPSSWTAGMEAGASYCVSWDIVEENAAQIRCTSDGRVSYLCAPPAPERCPRILRQSRRSGVSARRWQNGAVNAVQCGIIIRR